MTTQTMPRIAVVLPYAEYFGPAKAGAISLTNKEVNAMSVFKGGITVYGSPVETPFPTVPFQPLKPAMKWLLGRNVGFAEAFRRHVSKNPPDLVEVHSRPQVFHHLRRFAPSLKLALYLHNDPRDMRGAHTPAQRLTILRHAKAVYCVSRYIKQCMLDGIDGDFPNLHVIANGINRRWTALPAKEKRIVFVGRMVPDKGVLELVDAMTPVLKDHPDWEAVFVGSKHFGDPAPEGDYAKEVCAKVEALAPQAKFAGYMRHDEVMELFARSAVVAIPSLWNDPAPRVAVESMSAGCAVIATPRGGLPEVVEGRGIVLPDTSVESLREALRMVVSDPVYCQDLQRRTWADFPFTAESNIAQRDAIRQAVLGWSA